MLNVKGLLQPLKDLCASGPCGRLQFPSDWISCFRYEASVMQSNFLIFLIVMSAFYDKLNLKTSVCECNTSGFKVRSVPFPSVQE